MLHLSRKVTALFLFGMLFTVIFTSSFFMIQTFPASADPLPESAAVLIVMYHSVVDDNSATGEHVISRSQFISDLDWLAARGYTPVSAGDVIRYVREPLYQLPEKPVVLTFDDGFYNTYSVVLPIMQERGYKFTVSIVGSYADKETAGSFKQAVSYSYCNWEQIKELKESGLVEIANHTADMHRLTGRKGSLKNPSESPEMYRDAFCSDILSLEARFSEHLGEGSRVFAYPYGFYSDFSEELLKEMGFEAALTCEEGVNIVTKNSSSFRLKRYNRGAGISSARFFGAVR